jgi:hypothetical protein
MKLYIVIRYITDIEYLDKLQPRQDTSLLYSE